MADVTIASGTAVTRNARGMRNVVFTTSLIGYTFLFGTISGNIGVFSYCKTTDGGATWAAPVLIDQTSAITTQAFDVWFDQWTVGDNGTLIHTWWFDTTNNIVRWVTLDTNGDTLGTVRTVFTGVSVVGGRGTFVSGTKTRSGYLYCAYDLDAGAEKGFHQSTDGGTTWSASLSATFVEATLDQCWLFPPTASGDHNDCWAVYYDQSATALTLKLWDNSASVAIESATFQTHTEGVTDLQGQYGVSATVRHSDGHLIVAAVSLRDDVTSTHQIFDIFDTNTITTKTAITTNIDDHYHPALYIDQGTDALYVFYNGKRDGSETMDSTTKIYYTKSTDGGTTWTAGDTAYMEGAASTYTNVWAPLMGRRLIGLWRNTTTIATNAVNSAALTVYTDSFNRPNATGLGSGWFAAQSDAKIVSQEARASATSTVTMVYRTELFDNNQSASVRIAGNSATAQWVGVSVRMRGSGGTTSGYYAYLDAADGVGELRRYDNGVDVHLQFYAFTSPALGKTFKLMVEDNFLTAYIDEVLISVGKTDTTYPTGGAPGMFLYEQNAGDPPGGDDFLATGFARQWILRR